MTAYEAAVQEKDQLYARIQLVREEIKQEQDPGRRGEQKGRLRILFEMYHESLDRLDALRPPQEKRHKAVKRDGHTHRCCRSRWSTALIFSSAAE